MNFKLLKIDQLSGKKSSIYTIQIDEETTLFDQFIESNIDSHEKHIKEIVQKINSISNWTGAQENFFKLNEGIPADGVCALYDATNSLLRLYCIRYGNAIVILGGGGVKPKTVRKLQDDPKLKEQNYLLRHISAMITQRIRSGEIRYAEDEIHFHGNLEFIIE